MDPALAIMAGVRAHFQVAYKRFTDNVPLAIDQEFIKGVERGREETLYSGLKLSGPDRHKIARELVHEPGGIAAQREQLQKKLVRVSVICTDPNASVRASSRAADCHVEFWSNAYSEGLKSAGIELTSTLK